jgi:K+-sensing histidine kinase KdpD
MQEEITYFAPSARSDAKEILKEFDFVGSQKIFLEIFGTFTGVGAVIDKNRQIVYANDDFLKLLGITSIEPILGKRPGEVVSCIHSAEEPAGCGTSMACAYCGAVNAIMESQRTGLKSMKETRISTSVDGKVKSWDLNVACTPITLSGQIFYVLILQDISDEKRRSALERLFFHDLLNTAGGLNGILTILKEGTSAEETRELINLSEEASRDIVEEIISHRQIRAAENHDLETKIEQVNLIELLKIAVRKISSHEVGVGKEIILKDLSGTIYLETDSILFKRVIINLIKNALESTPRGGTVSTGIEDNSTEIRIWIKNDQVMSEEIQLQLFQRSFSTKGINRGVGTYSIKLITENYLKGKVSFVSNEKEGTIFSVILNKKFPADFADLR